MRRRARTWVAAAAALVAGLAPGLARAVTAEALAEQLARREAVTVIDVRGAAAFGEGHLPGALHLPASLAAEKRLPPLGRVVVCGDGIRAGETRRAAEALAAKPGLRVEVLEGGYAVWEARGLPTTRAAGMGSDGLHVLTYEALADVAAADPGLAFADLRRSAPEPWSDLAARFPGAGVVRAEWGPDGPALGALVAEGVSGRRLLVLVDDGDGVAEPVARRLRVAGVGRVAVLAGGEVALRREGRAGLRTVETGARP
ncbi:MAG: rhodanese-like domain-containing protein [Deferrisomatales bacterium]